MKEKKMSLKSKSHELKKKKKFPPNFSRTFPQNFRKFNQNLFFSFMFVLAGEIEF